MRLITLEDGSFATLEQLSGKTDAKLKANEALIAELANYDSSTWDTLLDQMSIADLCDLVENGGFHTYPIDSIGKIRAFDTDGPAGFNLNTLSVGDGDASKWTAYPSETVIGQTWNKDLAEKMGLCMGMEAQATAVQGWYAPGVNLHRTPYTARNYEYYSEDPLLSGVFAAKVIHGAKTNGLYCYLKHFVLSEPGPNPRKLNTWCTEQNLRENYLKPFEIAVKEGGANAIMSAFNRVGSVWAGANYACLVEILRNEWGFRGSVITDYAMTNEIGNMNPTQGVKAGNDLWLNPSDGTISNPLDRKDATTVAACRLAAKNIIYTFVDTYNFALNNDPLFAEYTTDIGVKTVAAGSEWWIPTLIAIEVVLGLGMLTYFAFALAGDIKIVLATPKGERQVREKRPFYITKRMKKWAAIILCTGTVAVVAVLVLVPLFKDILVDYDDIVKTVPVDKGDVFGTRFEFEHGQVEGSSVGEDHLCTAKSYYFDAELSESGALTNLQADSTASFSFLASKKYKISMNLRIASAYDFESNTWVEKKLADCLSISFNGEEADLSSFIIPAAKEDSVIGSDVRKDMYFVDVVGIPVAISDISNVYVFTLKEGCPALDYFTIYTSAEITDFEKVNAFEGALSDIQIKEAPTKMKQGSIEIGCPENDCDEKSTYALPLLSGKRWYTYNEDKHSYAFSVFEKPYIITPDTAGKAVGTIHSESKVVKNFKGANFFQGSNWNHQSSTKQKAEEYVYTMADIIDSEGNVLLDHSTPAKTKIFYCDSNERKPLTDYSNAANKDYLGKKIQYSFLMNASNGFVLSAFSNVYSDANLLAKNSVPGVFFKFSSSGNVSLTIGTDAGSPASDAKKSFRTTLDFIAAASHFNWNQDNWVKFEFTRHTPEVFELALYINDQQVAFPEMPESSTGSLERRYTQDGKIYIVQSPEASHTWGEYISVAPDEDSVVKFKDLNYSVGA